jgi:oligopeptide transport system substrate-binding protein
VRRPRALKRLALAALAAAIVAAAPAAARKWADPGKVLRVTSPIAETGFDPQATSDLYAGHVQRAIFEPLYADDYVART